jgi:hypothetical protein
MNGRKHLEETELLFREYLESLKEADEATPS